MRTLTITTNPNWKSALRTAGQRAKAGLASGEYQGETLNFETPAAFFSQLTERRWLVAQCAFGKWHSRCAGTCPPIGPRC
jgi:hypothetical protein